MSDNKAKIPSKEDVLSQFITLIKDNPRMHQRVILACISNKVVYLIFASVLAYFFKFITLSKAAEEPGALLTLSALALIFILIFFLFVKVYIRSSDNIFQKRCERAIRNLLLDKVNIDIIEKYNMMEAPAMDIQKSDNHKDEANEKIQTKVSNS